MEFLRITPEEDLKPPSTASNGQLGLWDRIEAPRIPERPIDVNLLIELEPEASRWRLRTVFLLSILAHLALLAVLYAGSGYIRRQQELVALEAENKPPKPIFLYLPPDLEKKLQEKPKTPNLSDKDRQARGKAPVIVPHAPDVPYSKGNTKLPEVAGGPPKAPAPPAQSAQPKPQANPEQGKEQAKVESKPSDDGLKLEDVPKPATSPGHLALALPQSEIEQSAAAAAHAMGGRGRASGPGDSLGQFNSPTSSFSLEGPMILSDTQGVDFGPYLARVIAIVKRNWYSMIPESVRYTRQQGKVAWDFAIQRDGSVPDLEMVVGSGSQALDEAAKSGIDLSAPFPPLPAEFKGKELRLRFFFLYNLGVGAQ